MPVAARILTENSLSATASGELDEAVVSELKALREIQHHHILQFIGIVTPSFSHTLVFIYQTPSSVYCRTIQFIVPTVVSCYLIGTFVVHQ